MAHLSPYHYQGGQVQLKGLANVPQGPHVTAESFGAGGYRDLHDLGGAFQKTGGTILDIAKIKKKRIDEAATRDSDTELVKDYHEWEKQILSSRKGMSAKNLDTETEQWFEAQKQKYVERLQGNQQIDMFEKVFAMRKADAVAHMSTYSFKEVEKGEKLSRDAQNDGFINDSAVHGLLNDNRVERNRRLAHANIAANFRGYSAEVLEAEYSKFDRVLYKTMLSSAAARSPQAALEYLEKEGVKKVFLPAEQAEMRAGYLKIQVEAEQKTIINTGTAAAIETIRSGGSPSDVYLQLVREVGKDVADKVMAGYDRWAGYAKTEAEAADKADMEYRKARRERGDEVLTTSAKEAGRENADMSEKEIRDYAYANFPEKYAEIVLQAAEAERKAVKADKAAESVERDRNLDRELQESGYDATRMPSYPDLTTDEKNKWLERGRKNRELSGEKPTANITRYNELQRMTDGELIEAWDAPGELDAIIDQLGGVNSKWFGNLQARIDKYVNDGKNKTEKAAKADASKFLDTELNTIERDALQTLRNTGRTLSKEARDQYLNDVLQYADRNYEEEMKRHQVEKPDELPLEVRRRIHADALLTYAANGLLSKPVTRAEAWAQNADVSGHRILPQSLPMDYRQNYVGGDIRTIPAEGGPAFIAVGIGKSDAPPNVQTLANAGGGDIMRDLTTGIWMVVSDREAFWLPPDASYSRVLDAEVAREIATTPEQAAPSDPEHLYPFGRAGLSQ